MKGDSREYESPQLSPDQSDELAKALGDGFRIYGDEKRGVVLSLKGLVDDRFFGAFASVDGTGDVCDPAEIKSRRVDGSDEEPLWPGLHRYLLSDIPAEGLTWMEKNPFQISFDQLEEFFIRRMCEYFDVPREYWKMNLSSAKYVAAFEPYSIHWFELVILAEFRAMRAAREAPPRSFDGHDIRLHVATTAAACIGRMVEHYRWRFSYGADALRGRATVESARAGAAARARQHATRSRRIIGEIKRYIGSGKTVSNAASLAFRRGFGASPEANRKLWYRHTRK
jgi:hypothetical protein